MTTIPSTPNPLSRLWNSHWFFWLLLSIPAWPLVVEGFNAAQTPGLLTGSRAFGHVLRESGEFAARFTIIALMLTPLVMLFPKFTPLRWLMKRRRYIGVAAFGFAALHTLSYLLQKGSFSAVTAELATLGIWTGWVAFVVFVPLALTSNDVSLRAMGRNWKTLQRFTYVAAIFSALHWYALEYELGGVLVHFLPLAVLEIYRLWRSFMPRRALA